MRALNYPKVRKYIRPGLDPELWFEDIVVLSHLVAGEHEFAGASKDPDDDKYIAAAIEGRARFVVAGDSDLLDLKEYDGIRIVSPRVFLDLSRRLDQPETLPVIATTTVGLTRARGGTLCVTCGLYAQ